VRGRDVVYARGFEVDVARVLARRLGIRRVRMVQVRDPERLTAPGAKRWDVSLARLVPTPRRRGVAYSLPYLVADQAVLVARGAPRPTRFGDLRRLRTCAVRHTTGAVVVRGLPEASRGLAANLDELLRWTQTGRCDAAVADGPVLGVRLRGSGGRYGAVAGRIETGAAFSLAVPAGSPLLVDLNRALRGMRRDGTLRRLALRWLAFDPARLRILGRAD
jgi:ABC-type amino acid transport substrate-binding protein